MWAGMIRPPYGTPGHEHVSFNEKVLDARGETTNIPVFAMDVRDSSPE